jgi:hypothetical protein
VSGATAIVCPRCQTLNQSSKRTCWICYRPLDPPSPTPAPRAPSLDSFWKALGITLGILGAIAALTAVVTVVGVVLAFVTCVKAFNPGR